jgi:hypothetical protein
VPPAKLTRFAGGIAREAGGSSPMARVRARAHRRVREARAPPTAEGEAGDLSALGSASVAVCGAVLNARRELSLVADSRPDDGPSHDATSDTTVIDASRPAGVEQLRLRPAPMSSSREPGAHRSPRIRPRLGRRRRGCRRRTRWHRTSLRCASVHLRSPRCADDRPRFGCGQRDRSRAASPLVASSVRS